MPPSQPTLGSVGSQHTRMLAYPLLARCVEGARCTGSSTIPLASTRSLMCSRPAPAQPRTSDAWAPTVCSHRSPLWARSARTTRGRLRINCSHAVWRAHDALARALYRSQARARSCAAAMHTRSLERVRRGHPPNAATAGHFAAACVCVARALCGGRTVHGLDHHVARNHALARAQPQFLCAASNE